MVSATQNPSPHKHLAVSAGNAYYEGQTDYPPTHLFPALTEVLGVSADAILGLKMIKRKSKASNQRLWRRLKEIEDLPQRERKQLLTVVDAFLDRNRLSKRNAS